MRRAPPMKNLVGEGKPLYSAVDKAAKGLKRKVGTGAEFMKELMGITGIKPTEIQERGLNEVMDMPRMTHEQFMETLNAKPAPAIREKVLGEKPSPADVIRRANANARISASNYAESADTSQEARAMRADELRRIRENHMPQMFQFARHELEGQNNPYHYDYTLPGGDNYREMLIKAPKAPKGAEEFPGVPGHFGGERNILASMRLKDRTGPNGEKLLHLEELQSDWHQQGRDKGYNQNIDKLPEGYTVEQNPKTNDYRVLDPQGRLFSSGMSPETATANAIDNLRRSGVPDAPFKKNWEEMALKRLIHHAAEKGYHGIVVTPGEEQADRYSLAKHIDALHYNPDTHRLIGKKNGRLLIDEVAVPPEKLESHIGKEAAQKVMAQEPNINGLRSLLGEDLQIGGEGMKGFYDKKVPNILNSIGKKYGVKTELQAHPIEKEPANRLQVGEMTYEDPAKHVQLHHFPITEEMRKDVLTNGLPLYSQGGKVHMADGGDMDQMQLELMNNQFNLYKAADRAKAGRMAAEAIKKEPEIKASEALGQLREKGFKRTTTTQSDRTRVGGGNIGGAAFPAISNVAPEYKGKPWGVMDTGTASRLTNLTNPETAWTTMLGSEHQLKTNPIVFDKLARQFQTAMKQGLLPPELEAKINHNLALTFGEGASIRDPKIWQMADTFEKRRALAELMMGQGIPPKKGGVSLGGEKSGKGVIFQPTKTLIQETEPSLFHPEHGGDIPTFAAGPRLFQLEKEVSYRPDLHPGFPTLIHGKDLKIRMKPVPTESYLPDWHKAFKKANPHRKKPGYYDLALGMEGQGLPSQELTDAYIRHLMTEGFKKGGKVKKMADGGLTSLIQGKGVEEAVDMPVKAFVMPRAPMSNSFPVGGVQQPPQAPQQPQQSMQTPQNMPPQGGPAQQPPSNILQMTPQGQAMSAIKPPQMKKGGSTRRVAYNHSKDTMMLELMDAKRHSKRK